MIYTKSILKPRETSDGIRISIMSRHTLNDGITPDSRINENSYDEWARVFAPPLKLIGDYYKRGLSWGDFERRYKKYLSSPEISSHVRNLASIALSENLTLLCIEDKPEFCHRRLLAEECRRIESKVEVIHK